MRSCPDTDLIFFKKIINNSPSKKIVKKRNVKKVWIFCGHLCNQLEKKFILKGLMRISLESVFVSFLKISRSDTKLIINSVLLPQRLAESILTIHFQKFTGQNKVLFLVLLKRVRAADVFKLYLTTLR